MMQQANHGGIRLRDYQLDTVSELMTPPENIWRQLAVLATGGGKTIVFADLLERSLANGQRALVLAHREELLDQAKDKIAMVAPDLDVEIEQAARRVSVDDGSMLFGGGRRRVIVASVQTMQRQRLKQWDPNAFSMIVCDEAHHSTADTYMNIFEHFNCFNDDARTPLVGVTATPNRTDGRGLGDVYQRIAAFYDIKALVERQHLVRIRCKRVRTTTSLDGVKITAGDYNLKQLEETVNGDTRNAQIVKAYLDHAPGTKAILFAAGVDHAYVLAEEFKRAGVTAEYVCGAHGRDDRRGVLDRFRSGETLVVTNFGVLTEGFDEPSVRTIILARPTKSSLLATQMIGRGTRLFEGKDHVLVIDVQDVTTRTSIVSVPSLMGLPEDFDADGGDVLEQKKRYDQLDPRIASMAHNMEDVERLMARQLKAAEFEDVDIFAAPVIDEYMEKYSTMSWVSLADGSYSMRIPESGVNSRMLIQCDTLGKWHVDLKPNERQGQMLPVAMVNSIEQAFRAAEAHIVQRFPTAMRLLDRTASWRGQPASEKQIALLRKFGLPVAEGLTKGGAGRLLDTHFAAKGKRRAS